MTYPVELRDLIDDLRTLLRLRGHDLTVDVRGTDVHLGALGVSQARTCVICGRDLTDRLKEVEQDAFALRDASVDAPVVFIEMCDRCTLLRGNELAE
jgi:hypothetical protein